MVWVIPDRIIQIPYAPVSGTHEVLHSGILKKSGFERSLAQLPPIEIGCARRPRPHLGDVPVTTIESREAGLGTDDLPMSVIEQAVCRNIATHLAARAPVKILHII